MLGIWILFSDLGRRLRLAVVGYLSPNLSSGSSLEELHIALKV